MDSTPLVFHYINLDRSRDRELALKAAFAEHEAAGLIRLKRFRATAATRPRDSRACEMACADSHLRLLRQAHARGDLHCIAIEDDVVPTPAFAETLLPSVRWLLDHLDLWDVAYLGTVDRVAGLPAALEPFMVYLHDASSAYGIIWNVRRVMPLIQATPLPLSRPIDIFLQGRVRQIQLCPHVVRPVDLAPSTIRSTLHAFGSNFQLHEQCLREHRAFWEDLVHPRHGVGELGRDLWQQLGNHLGWDRQKPALVSFCGYDLSFADRLSHSVVTRALAIALTANTLSPTPYCSKWKVVHGPREQGAETAHDTFQHLFITEQYAVQHLVPRHQAGRVATVMLALEDAEVFGPLLAETGGRAFALVDPFPYETAHPFSFAALQLPSRDRLQEVHRVSVELKRQHRRTYVFVDAGVPEAVRTAWANLPRVEMVPQDLLCYRCDISVTLEGGHCTNSGLINMVCKEGDSDPTGSNTLRDTILHLGADTWQQDGELAAFFAGLCDEIDHGL